MWRDPPKSVSALSAILLSNNRSITTCVLKSPIQKVFVSFSELCVNIFSLIKAEKL